MVSLYRQTNQTRYSQGLFVLILPSNHKRQKGGGGLGGKSRLFTPWNICFFQVGVKKGPSDHYCYCLFSSCFSFLEGRKKRPLKTTERKLRTVIRDTAGPPIRPTGTVRITKKKQALQRLIERDLKKRLLTPIESNIKIDKFLWSFVLHCKTSLKSSVFFVIARGSFFSIFSDSNFRTNFVWFFVQKVWFLYNRSLKNEFFSSFKM